jgi:hypothetical protein
LTVFVVIFPATSSRTVDSREGAHSCGPVLPDKKANSSRENRRGKITKVVETNWWARTSGLARYKPAAAEERNDAPVIVAEQD